MMKRTYILIVAFLIIFPTFYAHAQEVDLIWQGNTYVSPFYKGKMLWSYQSRITLVAIPRGVGTPSRVNYRWTKNGTVLGNVSGVGRNTLTFLDSVLSKPQTVKVDIMNSDTSVVLATASVILAPTPPTLLVYENNPLYGFMFHKAVDGTFSLRESEVTFTIFPKFSDISSRSDASMVYEWRTNTGELEARNSATYRVPEGTSGTSRIDVMMSNTGKIMEDVRKSFFITFEDINSI